MCQQGMTPDSSDPAGTISFSVVSVTEKAASGQ